MTDTDIEALVAEARAALKINPFGGLMIQRLANALERQQAVVEAARAVHEGSTGVADGTAKLGRLGKALAALDAKPEGEG